MIGMRAATLVSLMLTVMVLGGCVEPTEPAETSSTEEEWQDTWSPTDEPMSPSNTTNAPSNTSGPGEMNSPPEANLTSDVSNGTAPLNVTFEVNGTDPDEDNLTWELDVDGDNMSDYNGTDADFGAIAHNYTENGTFNVTLVVSDGELNATANMTVNVTAGAAGAKFEDSVLLPCPTCPGRRTETVEFELTPDLWGLPFEATSTRGDPDMIFVAEDCDGDMVEDGEFATEGAEEGDVPEGAACIIIWEYLRPDSDITVIIGTPPEEEEP